MIELPEPRLNTQVSLDSALRNRRTCREFSTRSVSLEQVSSMLWAGQGIFAGEPTRVAPSAGAQYPMSLGLMAVNVEGLEQGYYVYQPEGHKLKMASTKDCTTALSDAAIGDQYWIEKAALTMVISARLDSMNEHFFDQPPEGQRGGRYVYIETGAVMQNLHLQLTVMGLGAVFVGGFNDEMVVRAVNLSSGLSPTGLMCVGVPEARV